MERKGLVTATKGIIRKDMISLRLTDKGREAFKNSRGRQSIHNIFAPLSMENRKQLWSILLILWESAVKETKEGDTFHYPKPPS